MSVDRVAKLIALAGNNPNEHEARTAAYQACRIIREGGLLVLAPDDPRLSGGTTTATAPAAGINLDDMIRDIQRQTERIRRENERWVQEQREATREAERRAQAAARRQKKREAADPFKYNGTHGAPHARPPTDAEVKERKQRARRKGPERVILDELTRCNTCGYEQAKGKRVWRHEGKPGVTCGLCENGVP